MPNIFDIIEHHYRTYRIIYVTLSVFLLGLGLGLAVQHGLYFYQQKQAEGKTLPSYTDSQEISTMCYWFEHEWHSIPDGDYLLIPDPYGDIAPSEDKPNYGILISVEDLYTYAPLNVKHLDLTQPFHTSCLEYTREEAEKQDVLLEPYYVLHTSDGYGKVEKSYVYPDTFYEDYDDIKERGDTARNILLLHYLEGKQARKARITAELKALEEEEQMEKEQESTGNPSEPADTDTQENP